MTRSVKLLGLAAACAACCAVPLVGASAIIGTGAGATLAGLCFDDFGLTFGWVEGIGVLTLTGGSTLLVLRRRRSAAAACATDCSCSTATHSEAL